MRRDEKQNHKGKLRQLWLCARPECKIIEYDRPLIERYCITEVQNESYFYEKYYLQQLLILML